MEAEDWDLGAQLAAQHWFDLFVRGQSAALRALVGALPAERLEDDAELAAAMACTALEAGDPLTARRYLEQAQRAESALPDGRRRAYLETMALAHLYLARREGDFESALTAADTLLLEAADHGGWSHDARRALVHLTLGETAMWAQYLDRARGELENAIALARAIELDYVLVAALSQLALLDHVLLGSEPGTGNATEAIALAERRGWSSIPQTACAHTALAAAALHFELRPDLAEERLQLAIDAITNVDARQVEVTVAQLRARIHEAQGRPQDGLNDLVRFEAAHRGRATTRFERTSLACTRARLLATMGDLDGARVVLDVVRDEPWVGVAATEGRLLLAAGDAAAAAELLGAAEERFAPYANSLSAVEMAVLQAIACDEAGDTAAATRSLELALERSELTGHRWAFIEMGRRMEALLRAQIRAGTAHRAVVGELIAAFEDRLPVRRPIAPLLEPLSDREQAILRYLPTTLSNREIAAELFVTTNTVKTHLRSIYRKLDVARRRDAVDRARDLRLLSSGLGR